MTTDLLLLTFPLPFFNELSVPDQFYYDYSDIAVIYFLTTHENHQRFFTKQ